MKLLKSNYKLLCFAVVGSALITCVLFSYFMPQVILGFHLYWIFVLGAAVIVFSPAGRKKLIVNDKAFPMLTRVQWLSQIIIFQLSLFAVFWGVCQLVGKTLPIYLHLNSTSLFAETVGHTFLAMGLFPWVGVALIACMLGCMGFQSHQDTPVSRLLFKAAPHRVWPLMINTASRSAMMFALSSTIALLVLFFVSVISPQNLNSLKGAQFAGIIFSVLMLFFVVSKFVKKRIYFAMTRYRLATIIVLYGLFLCLIVIVIILAFFLGNGFSHHLETPHFFLTLIKQGALVNWHLFAFLWWFSWMLVASVLIAQLSRGYSLRTVLLAVIAVPLVISLICLFIPLTGTASTPDWLVLIISGLGLFGLLAVITPRHRFFWLVRMTIPKGGKIINRSSDRFVLRIVQFTVIMLILYLSGSVVLLNLIFGTFLIILSGELLAVPLLLFRLLAKRRSRL